MKEERYMTFIKRCIAKNAIMPPPYIEKHHVIPKCLGGSDDSSNIAELTPRQHYIAHAMLSILHKENLKIQQAFWIMLHGSGKHKRVFKSKLYHSLKSRRSELMKGVTPAQFKEFCSGKSNAKLFSGKVRVFDTTNPDSDSFWVTKEEFLSNANLVSWSKGSTIAYDKDGNKVRVPSNDIRLKDGTLVSLGKMISQNNKGSKNASFKGFYKTPKGTFETSLEAAESHGIHPHTIMSRCVSENKKKIIHPNSLKRSSDLKDEDFQKYKNKTWEDLGWGFIPT